MTVVELRAKCVSRKLSQVGLKQQLIQVRGVGGECGRLVVRGWLCCGTCAGLAVNLASNQACRLGGLRLPTLCLHHLLLIPNSCCPAAARV